MKKGHTAAEAVEQLKKLNEAQIPFNSILIYGLGGAGCAKENAVESAKMLNQVRSANIIMMNLTVFPDTELENGARTEALCRQAAENALKNWLICWKHWS